MTLCCHKDDAPALRAQIFALISTVLKDSNEEAIAMIIRKNECGLSALGKVYLGSIWVHTGPSALVCKLLSRVAGFVSRQIARKSHQFIEFLSAAAPVETSLTNSFSKAKF